MMKLGKKKGVNSSPGLWLADTFSTPSLLLLHGIVWIISGSKSLTASLDRSVNRLVFDWLKLFFNAPLKLMRKPVLRVFYRVCVFRVGLFVNRDGRLSLLLSEAFSSRPVQSLNWIYYIWRERSFRHSLQQLRVFCQVCRQRKFIKLNVYNIRLFELLQTLHAFFIVCFVQ